MTAIAHTPTFPTLLRTWRRAAGLSQLRLAGLAGASQRHISFLESGRANPSRVMVFALSEALNVPFRDRNDLLMAAGFAPKYTERALEAPGMAPVRNAVDQILQRQEPFPALVLDRLYNIRAANRAAARLTAFLFGDAPPTDPEIAGNLLRVLLGTEVCRERITNWALVASVLLRRLQAEAAAPTAPTDTAAFFEEIMTYAHLPSDWRQRSDADWRHPMLTVEFAGNDRHFSLFSTFTILGAPFDITLQEIRIESYFPADDEAVAFFATDDPPD